MSRGQTRPEATAVPGTPSCCQGSSRASRRHSDAGPKCKRKARSSGQSADPGLASNAEGKKGGWGAVEKPAVPGQAGVPPDTGWQPL